MQEKKRLQNRLNLYIDCMKHENEKTYSTLGEHFILH